jgi:hypothetical protein
MERSTSNGVSSDFAVRRGDVRAVKLRGPLLCIVLTIAGASARAETPADSVPPTATAPATPAAPPTEATGPARPDPTTVTLTSERETLTLGLESSTTMLVTVTGPLAAAALPGRTQATVGVISPLVPLGVPGTFSAEYHVPQDRRPQSAIVVAEVLLPGGVRAHAATRLLLPAATNFPLRTSPNTAVTLEVGEQLFGPRKADGEGNVQIPIIVPPGVGTGRARAVTRFGSAKETEVDLQVQDYDRILLVAPPDGVAGATVIVEAWAVDPSGTPSAPEDIDVRASSGKIVRLGGDGGVARFAFTLPGPVGAGAVALVASMGDGTSVKPGAMIVHAGPLANIAISTDTTRLVVGRHTVAALTLTAGDQFGNPVSIHGIAVTANGQPLPVLIGASEARTEVTAPETWPGHDQLAIEAILGSVRSAVHIPMTGGSPARLTLKASTSKVDANGSNGIDLLLEAFDDRGTPTSIGHLDWRTEDDGSLEVLPPPRFGSYAARFVPRRALRDRSAAITATVDGGLVAMTNVLVEAGNTRAAVARVGVASNLRGAFGQVAFVEATIPLRKIGRFSRLLSAGVAFGYVHSELTTSTAAVFPAAHVNINQAPLMALARIRMPGEMPMEVSLSGTAGVTFASTAIVPEGDTPTGNAHGNAVALVVGAGADASILLQPGELVIGARYLHADLGRNSNGDQLTGNSVGVVCDLGFRMGF